MQLVLLVICLAFAAFRSPNALVAENLMLRHQLIVLHDNDSRFGCHFDRALRHMGIRPISTPLCAPLANAICERVIGTLRREVLDHMLIWNARHLVRTLHEACRWYNEARPHQTLGQQTPRGYTPPEEPVPPSDVVSIPVLGGLHHEYHPKAA